MRFLIAGAGAVGGFVGARLAGAGQDVSLLVGKFNAGDKAAYDLKPGRHAWVQVATGKITLNGVELKAGDGAAINDEKVLNISGKEPSQVLVFDLN